ncbi:hypothetical protein MUO14_24000 [Halobacillus shinanisalinarum]|uniref:Uncharacterized protein n=1 Tax=Halobacillus shinanisalinarum TaxID=2932258 RepID=A0ABY4H0G5_9BACI|nr:hypothetical protein [Halobacillus shinanisalinarum]UOQ93395.1 hypothetical protein MUO14_24000 [Halobacillus shinanisalinarum]
MPYKDNEQVQMTLERYEDMQSQLQAFEDLKQRFFTVTEKEDHVSVIVHLDEIEKWSKENHRGGLKSFTLNQRKEVEAIAYVGVKPE